MTNFFEINGYWKDNNNDKLISRIVSDSGSLPDETEPYTDEDIFFYGLSEKELSEAVKLKEKTIHEFVITSYKKL